jgi:hypothetical protein
MNDSTKPTRVAYLSGVDKIDKNELFLDNDYIVHYLETYGRWLDTYIDYPEFNLTHNRHGKPYFEEIVYSHVAPTYAMGLQHNCEMWCEDETFQTYLVRAWDYLGFNKLEIKFLDSTENLYAYIGVIGQLIEEDALALVMGMADREHALRALGRASSWATDKRVVSKEIILTALESLKHE